MAFDQSVRTMMNNAGYDNSKIGYDGNSGNVTYNGSNFMKPQMNVNGTTYSDQSSFDNAHNQYQQNNPASQSSGQSSSNPSYAGASAGQNGKFSPNGYTNPYTQQISDIMSHLQNASSAASQPVDVYNSPQYAAAQAAQQRSSQQAMRQASESAAGAGLGHSTIMTDRTQRIQGDSDNYLQTQLVPQIMSQMQAQKQQELQNQQSMFNNVYQLSNQADSQHNADRTYDAGRQDAATAATGYYNPTGQTVAQIQQIMARNSAEYASSTPERQQELHNLNLQLGLQLGETYDPATGTYSQGNGQVGIRTVQGQQLDQQKANADYQKQVDQKNFDYKQARDQIVDGQYKQKFDEDNRRYGLDFALKQAVEAGQLRISQQNADTSSANGAASRANMNADNTRQDNAVNLSTNQRKFAGSVQTELSQAKSRADVVNFFNANSGEITSQLGSDAFTKMKNDALAQYDKVTPTDKLNTTSREKALSAAQKDTRWDLKGTDRNALISEYEAYYN